MAGMADTALKPCVCVFCPRMSRDHTLVFHWWRRQLWICAFCLAEMSHDA